MHPLWPDHLFRSLASRIGRDGANLDRIICPTVITDEANLA